MQKIRVLVVIDHDIMIRHFVFSGALRSLMETHEVLWAFPEKGYRRRVTIDIDSMDILGRVEHIPVDLHRQGLWSKLHHVSRLRWWPGGHAKAMRQIIRDAIGPGHVREYTTLALPGLYHLFRHRILRRLHRNENEGLVRVIDSFQPQVVLHPTTLYGPFVNDLVDVCARRHVPMVAMMNSWDNIATKLLLYLKPDWLVVWGEQTQRHAVKYLSMNPDKVLPFGAAQFDVYHSPPRITRDDFCTAHDIDPQRRIILYAGSNMVADEYAHLKLLDDAIESGVLPQAVIVYRPHPWGVTSPTAVQVLDHPWRHVRLDQTLRPHLEALRTNPEAWFFPDYRSTCDVLATVDGVISPLSTIILEAMINGKPVVCFHPIDETVALYDTLAPLAHFEEIYASPDVLTAYGNAELLTSTRMLLDLIETPGIAQRMQKASRYFNAWFDRSYSDRLVEFVERLAVEPGTPS